MEFIYTILSGFFFAEIIKAMVAALNPPLHACDADNATFLGDYKREACDAGEAVILVCSSYSNSQFVPSE
jgi:hypothetical protein